MRTKFFQISLPTDLGSSINPKHKKTMPKHVIIKTDIKRSDSIARHSVTKSRTRLKRPSTHTWEYREIKAAREHRTEYQRRESSGQDFFLKSFRECGKYRRSLLRTTVFQCLSDYSFCCFPFFSLPSYLYLSPLSSSLCVIHVICF